jgi:hypothetical protein
MYKALWLLVMGLWCCKGPDTGPQDSGQHDSSDTTDTGGGEDTSDDTDAPCAEPWVSFTTQDGNVQDVSDFFTTGDYMTLAVPGTLQFCPGTWWARVLIRADVAVIGLGDSPAQTILSGGEAGTILDISGPDVLVTVDNVTFDRGAGLQVEHNSGGGGIYCDQEGTVFVQDAIFSNNFANDGAGMYAQSCTLNVSAASFVDNLSDDDGGAFTVWDSTVDMADVDFQSNDALDGGAMAMFDSVVNISRATFADNTGSNFSAGIWVYQSDIRLTDVTLQGNVNDGSDYGGGLIVHGSAVLERVTFQDNSAPLGGGLFVYYGATVDGNDCDFSGNTPQDIYAARTEGGGTSYDADSDYSFSCHDDKCFEE